MVNNLPIGVDSVSAQYRPEGGDDPVEFKIWDTAGQERFRTITPQMFRLAQGVIIAFDLTKRETFEGVKVWADCIHKQAKDINVPKVLVGNKVDLADQGGASELRQVLRSEGQKAAQSFESQYFETSAKENVNVQELMQHIMSLVYKAETERHREGDVRDMNSIVITRKTTAHVPQQADTSGCKC